VSQAYYLSWHKSRLWRQTASDKRDVIGGRDMSLTSCSIVRKHDLTNTALYHLRQPITLAEQQADVPQHIYAQDGGEQIVPR